MPGDKRKIIRQIISFAGTAVFVCIFDQWTKLLAERSLVLNNTVPVINGMFHFTLVHNTGAAFGILRSKPEIFIYVSVLAILFIPFFIFKNRFKLSTLEITAMTFIFSGASGNLIDRVLYGHVIDFFDLRVWPVFNVADSFITIGAMLLVWTAIRKSMIENQGKRIK